MKFSIVILYVSILITACQPGIRRLSQNKSLFKKGRAIAKIDQRLKEVSGLVCSIKNKNMLWAINDGGNGASLFLIDQMNGSITKEFKLDIDNRDWEAITISYNSATKKSFLFIADIGDNNAQKETKSIYWLEEPHLTTSTDNTVHMLQINFKSASDMEAISVDPGTGDLYPISKREDSVNVYSIRHPFKNSSEVTPHKIKTIPYTYIVDCNASLNGEAFLMKDYKNVFYWKKNPEESIEQVVMRDPTVVSYKREIQGEAICFDRESKGYFTLGESWFFKRAKLFYYERK